MPFVKLQDSIGLRTPRVYRFLERQYADRFFETGELLVSSFMRFASNPDEAKCDVAEGGVHLVHRTASFGGQTLHLNVEGFGDRAYALCGSLNPSRATQTKFGADSGIVITDPYHFALEVAKVIPGFRRAFQGPCSYQAYRAIECDLGPIDFGCSEATSDPYKLDQTALQQAFSTMLNEDAFFIKHSDFHAECEYRLVWLVGHVAREPLVVKVPDARQYCRRWEDLGWIEFGGRPD